jgi:hypothetical protein
MKRTSCVCVPQLHIEKRVEARGHVPDISATSSGPLSPVADQQALKESTGTEVELGVENVVVTKGKALTAFKKITTMLYEPM